MLGRVDNPTYQQLWGTSHANLLGNNHIQNVQTFLVEKYRGVLQNRSMQVLPNMTKTHLISSIILLLFGRELFEHAYYLKTHYHPVVHYVTTIIKLKLSFEFKIRW